ncbi:hypothetical protein QBC35DRAFT_480174 [Podospora australis]|uniref:DUF202 domain-containing protein n=1 Tax=Podospora australis TaxID=1536484 RepID=A0AAN6X4B3_9PEZI|nr:hypothetical protein QBC35DRAFT_480174 [Podospora australis]
MGSNMTSTITDEEDLTISSCCASIPAVGSLTKPVLLCEHDLIEEDSRAFWLPPLFGPLIFDNESSDCRDHCANERTFLSYLRLSVYMSIVAVAIVLSFHLRKTASDMELRMAKPLGAIFWLLSVSCLGVGLANYIKTVNKYSRRAAIVQTGWKTQTAMASIALTIVATCVALLVVNKLNEGADD